MEEDILRPTRLCAEYERQYPDVFKHIDRARLAAQQRGVEWPRWCYVPMTIVMDVIMDRYRLPPIEVVGQSAIATALATWRAGGKHVLLVHPEVQRELLESGVEGAIPTDVLLRFPFWGAYIPLQHHRNTPGLLASCRGIFVHLEYDLQSGREELRCVFDLEGVLTPAVLDIDERLTLDAALRKTYSFLDYLQSTQSTLEAKERHYVQQTFVMLREAIGGAVATVLYVCAENAEMRSDAPAPKRPAPKKGERVYAPSQQTVWAVAWRIGAAIGAARQAVARVTASAPTGRTVRPHIRRAHWHTYRVGKGRASTVVHWLPPIPVNMPDDVDASAWADLLPVTRRDVGKM